MLKRRKQQIDEPTLQKPLRLWPGVVIVMLQLLVRFGAISITPEAVIFGVFGGLFCGLAVVMWWVFFSRVSRFERWSAVALITVALLVTWFIIHESMRLMPFVAYIIPVLSFAFVIWAVASRSFSDQLQRITMVSTILFA